MPKQRKKPRHIKKKAAHAANCGIAAVGSFAMLGLAILFVCFVGPEAKRQEQARQNAEFERILADRKDDAAQYRWLVAALASAPVEFVSKPVHLYKPGEKLSKSAAAVAKANDVALLAAFVPGEVVQ